MEIGEMTQSLFGSTMANPIRTHLSRFSTGFLAKKRTLSKNFTFQNHNHFTETERLAMEKEELAIEKKHIAEMDRLKVNFKSSEKRTSWKKIALQNRTLEIEKLTIKRERVSMENQRKLYQDLIKSEKKMSTEMKVIFKSSDHILIYKFESSYFLKKKSCVSNVIRYAFRIISTYKEHWVHPFFLFSTFFLLSLFCRILIG